MTREETAIVLATLSAAFPNWTITTETVRVWHQMLQDLDGESVFRVAQEWVLTEEKYPTIAGVRRKAAELVKALAPSASEAWEEVSDVAERYGVYEHERRPRWSHDLIRRTVKAIGYYHICMTDNVATVRAQFIKMYNDFAKEYNEAVITSKYLELGGETVALPYSTMVGLPSPQKGLPDIGETYDPRNTQHG